jgi:hypothetical protein
MEKRMHTTNYHGTFIEVADDCPVTVAEAPPAGKDKPTVASRQHDLIAPAPYRYTSDDVIFTVHVERAGIPEQARVAERERFFAKGQPCLRSSPLAKRYGWGIHCDAEGRVALVPVESEEYRRLAADPDLRHVKAMRSKRA